MRTSLCAGVINVPRFHFTVVNSNSGILNYFPTKFVESGSFDEIIVYITKNIRSQYSNNFSTEQIVSLTEILELTDTNCEGFRRY